MKKNYFSSFKKIGFFEQKKIGKNIYYSINQEVYDKLKTLVGNIFNFFKLMSFINVIFPVEKIRNFLAKRKLYGLEYFLASFFGAITPFCSCSSIPLFIGFLKYRNLGK